MMQTAEFLRRLVALQGAGRLGARSAKRCASLIARLQAPVRIAVFGAPGSGKAALINAMAEAPVLRIDAQVCPVLIAAGPEPRLVLTHGDGATEPEVPALPFCPPDDALLADLTLPLPTLEGLTLLDVVSDGSFSDMLAALTWAGPRCDIAVWSTRNWNRAEQALWQAAPDRLKNHAQMALATGAARPDPAILRAVGFNATPCLLDFDTDGALSVASAEALRDGLRATMAEARAEDRDAALLFLEQHEAVAVTSPGMFNSAGAVASPGTLASAVTVASRKAVASSGLPSSPGTFASPGVPPSPRPQDAIPDHLAADGAGTAPAPEGPQSSQATILTGPPPEAWALLSRLVLQVRQSARALSADLRRAAPMGSDGSLLASRIRTTVDALLDLAEADDLIAETWPDLMARLRAAGEMAMLLEIEGGEARAHEATVLLAQVRQDLDRAVAA